VGHALRELPRIAAAFAAGGLSYSKVRTLTRVATAMNEADLVMLAEHATAAQVDRIVSSYRGVSSAEEELVRANRRVVGQYLRADRDEDGSLVVHARVPSEVGALFLRSLDAAHAGLAADAKGEGGPAGTCPQAAPRDQRRCAPPHGRGGARARHEVAPRR
jgi:hypothetical protein